MDRKPALEDAIILAAGAHRGQADNRADSSEPDSARYWSLLAAGAHWGQADDRAGSSLDSHAKFLT